MARMYDSPRQHHGISTERGDDWRDKAASANVDPAIFFPEASGGPTVQQIERAKNICRNCEVIRECLNDVLSRKEQAGIAAGMTERQRKALLKIPEGSAEREAEIDRHLKKLGSVILKT